MHGKTLHLENSRRGRVNPLWTLIAVGVVLTVLMLGLLRRVNSTASATAIVPLRLYCAAGMRVPVEQIVAQYHTDYGVPVEIQYGGSNTLLNQLQVNRSADADLFLAADEFYLDKAIKLGLADDVIPIAYTIPVLAVPRGNPAGIKSLADLLRPDVRIAIADPDQAAIGKAVRERLQQTPHADGDMWGQLLPQITARGVLKPTVNDVANDLKLGAVDAGFVWDSTLAMPDYREVLKRVPAAELTTEPDVIAVTRLNSSSQPAAAARLVRFLAARDKGLTVFRQFGVLPVDGDAWSEQPELTFFCGAVNRRVVDQIVQDFQRDEGVAVNTIYDGCGILTSRMKTIDQQRPDLGFPDLYMACDRYYLDDIEQVRGWFLEAAYVSEADLVLVVKKGDTRVRELADLLKPEIRVAIGQPDQCTIGVLSWKMLEDAGLADQMRDKLQRPDQVVVEKSSSSHLVPDVVTGHIDAAIAYVTDTLSVRDQVDVIPIQLPGSKAIQPITIARSSDHKYLARRLFRRIASSRLAFESAGFRYRSHDQQAESGETSPASSVHEARP
ncbi:MAG: molybdate ABC transporter substrate-binding protein [Planctomycetaceae bacterium]